MKSLNIISVLIIFLLGSLNMTAQQDIISAQEFMTLKKSADNLVVVDANKPKNFVANHIKGAVNIYHNDLYQDGEIAGLIKSPEELAAFFGKKGISETSKVVIYDDGSQKYSSRVYWILKYLGAEDVRVLHKDIDTWRDARIPLTGAPEKIVETTFTPTLNPAIFVSTMEVKKATEKPEAVIVDCRTADEYNGLSKSEGHIPGAININYEELLTDTGAFKDVGALKTIAEKYGVTPDKEVILYCRTSVRAAPAFIAFKNILGYENVKVYDGAYLEWVASHPVIQ